jgi:hypothetical protein
MCIVHSAQGMIVLYKYTSYTAILYNIGGESSTDRFPHSAEGGTTL